MKNWVKILHKLHNLGWSLPELAAAIGDTEFNTRFAIQEKTETETRRKIENAVGWTFDELLYGKRDSVAIDDEISTIKTEIDWRQKTIDCFGKIDPKEQQTAEKEIRIFNSILRKLENEREFENGKPAEEIPAEIRQNVELSKNTIAGIASA